MTDPMPVFPIKAKDALASTIVAAYRQECIRHDLHGQAEQVWLALEEILAWQRRNPEFVNLPDHKHVPVQATPLTKTLNAFAADFINTVQRGLFKHKTCTQDEALTYITGFLGSPAWRPAAIALLTASCDAEAGDTVEVDAEGRPLIVRAGTASTGNG
jgi:hypothetical protein